MIGTSLSHYRITSALGAGGMGEVYRATDTNLDRDVAIKVLPPEVAQDPERLGRFKREAHLLAALNHPNIAAIYGLEEANGKPFLALELVEGEDLKERLSRGAIPVDEALEIAKQIAEALEEAHGKGIVHRDLKPANVKLTAEGKVKVLDFGLAKAWAGDASGVNSGSAALSQSPTLAHTGTIAGVILGTAAYMSPEQARGKPVDKRSDVWSFGVLLWEMLTGRSLFAGETVTDVIAQVVTREPDLDALPQATPRSVRRLLSRCLRKDPRTRLPDIGAARLELQEAIAGASPEADAQAIDGSVTADARGSRTREWVAWTLAFAATAVAVGLALVQSRKVERPRLAARFAVEAPEGWSLGPVGAFGWPVPSPDGRQVVFLAAPEAGKGVSGASTLWVRPLESMASRPLAGTEGAGVPFWSPDGRSLGFFAQGQLRRLNLADGTVQRICKQPAEGIGGADWNEAGTILFSAGGPAGRIYSVAATGGDAKELMAPDAARREANHHSPQFLPDGRRFLFTVASQDGASADVDGTYVASLDAPQEKHRVAPGWARRVYAAGHLLFVRDGALLAQPFDVEKATSTGEPVAVAAPVAAWSVSADFGRFGVSQGETLALFSGQGSATQLQLTWLDRKGGQIGTVGEPGDYGQLTLSPDGTKLAVEVRDQKLAYDIWVMDVARGVASRVTSRAGDDRDPVWAPDGRSLAFWASGAGKGVLRRKGLRAADPETPLTETTDEDHPEHWSRDGKTLLVVRRTPDDAQGVWAVAVGGESAEALLDARFHIDEPQLSPDERWLAYVSRESGRDEVYVEPFRAEGERVRVSVDGGGQPKWRGDGKELFYATPASVLMAVEVRPGSGRLQVSLPTRLFEFQGFEGAGYDDYAPSADGRRFLVKLVAAQDRKPQIHVVTNWPALLSLGSK
jgi:eukaryotic-like serine/threonine-protein kinase